ncbi:MAG: class I SAM-dependent methyltransferase [Longimicrobiales bacterium]
MGRLYDLVMGMLERGWLAALREQLWREAPAQGLGLDLGAGTGANFVYYPAGGMIVAAEPSASMMKRAVAKNAPTPRLLVRADAQALPFRGDSLDFAVATLVFCEVPDPLEGFEEVRRVLKPGAPILMLEHVKPRGRLGDVARLLTRLTGPLFGEHYDRQTTRTLQDAGFTLEQEQRYLHDAVVRLQARKPGA